MKESEITWHPSENVWGSVCLARSVLNKACKTNALNHNKGRSAGEDSASSTAFELLCKGLWQYVCCR